MIEMGLLPTSSQIVLVVPDFTVVPLTATLAELLFAVGVTLIDRVELATLAV
jgi:hypothetical protein